MPTPRLTNRHGLKVSHFERRMYKLLMAMKGLDRTSFARILARMAMDADEGVLAEPEFSRGVQSTSAEKWQVFHKGHWFDSLRLGADVFGNQAFQISAGPFQGVLATTTDRSLFRKDPEARSKPSVFKPEGIEISTTPSRVHRPVAAAHH